VTVLRGFGRAAVALAAIVGLLWGSAPAGALPPDGPSPDTPGTSSSVSPRQLEAGQTINFTVSGFPAGETLNIKIDDGLNCSQVSVFGACVVHKQRIPASGTVNGSFTVPVDVGTGPHWLRFLASELINGGPESRGYTNRGNSDFTVVEPYTPPPATTEAPPATTAAPVAPPATTEAPPTTSEAVPTTSAAPPTTSAASSVTPTASASLSPLPAVAEPDDDGGGSGGAVVIGLVAVVAAAAIGGGIIYLRNRKGGSAGGAPAP